MSVNGLSMTGGVNGTQLEILETPNRAGAGSFQDLSIVYGTTALGRQIGPLPTGMPCYLGQVAKEKAGDPSELQKRFRFNNSLLIGFLLTVGTIWAFLPVLKAPFLDIDDPGYVTENIQVLTGLTPAGVVWAFTTLQEANYHPLTWLSHMSDVEAFGISPRGHHLTNLLLHAANVVLLFLLLQAMAGATWRSAFVAALFAIHPMHVESVAWVAERKDILCVFFALLALLAYLRYVRKPDALRYALVAILFAMALLSKPMVVTLPFVMLLLDVWPLNRRDVTFIRRVWEKAPLMALSIASCALTVVAQANEKALILTLRDFPLHKRAASSLVAYATYVRKMFWPADLAVYYPYYDFSSFPWKIVGAAVFLCAISVIAWQYRKRFPWLLIGWLWYLGTLVPVIGLVRVGEQFIADRYSYLPYIGLFLIVAWGLCEAMNRLRLSAGWIAPGGLLVLAFLGYATRTQASYWLSNEALYSHAVQVVDDNWFALNNLGVELARQGRQDEAITCYREALRIHPLFANAFINLGVALGKQGRLDEAAHALENALIIQPDSAGAYNNLGIVLKLQKRFGEAEKAYLEAIRLNPEDTSARYNLALNYIEQSRFDDAVLVLREILQRNPGYENATALLEDVLHRGTRGGIQ